MPEPIKVFVSYSWGAEKETRIVDELERLCKLRGIELIRDKNRIKHGESIKQFMDELSKGNHVITVFSKAYFQSPWCMYELLRIFQRGDFAERTHPVLSDDCDLQDTNYRLSLVKFWNEKHETIKSDLAGFNPEAVAAEINESRIYRDISQNINEITNFAKNRLTTPLAELQKNNYTQLLDTIKPLTKQQEPSKQVINKNSLTPDQRAAWINREPQWDYHIKDRIDKNSQTNKAFAFIVAGVREEWPESLQLRLGQQYGLKEKHIQPDFTGKFTQRRECGLWYSLLEKLLVDKEEIEQLKTLELYQYEQKLVEVLSESGDQTLFCWELRPGLKEHLDGKVIKDLVDRWQTLALTESRQPHYLVIVYGCVDRGLFKFGERKVEKWRHNLKKLLSEEPTTSKIVTPKLESPNKEEVNSWLRIYHKTESDRFKIYKQLSKKLKWGRAPHLALLEAYLEIYRS